MALGGLPTARPQQIRWCYFHKIGRMEIVSGVSKRIHFGGLDKNLLEDDVPSDGVEGVLKVQFQHQVPRVQFGEVCPGSMNSTLCSQPGAVAHLKGQEQGAHFLKN